MMKKTDKSKVVSEQEQMVENILQNAQQRAQENPTQALAYANNELKAIGKIISPGLKVRVYLFLTKLNMMLRDAEACLVNLSSAEKLASKIDKALQIQLYDLLSDFYIQIEKYGEAIPRFQMLSKLAKAMQNKQLMFKAYFSLGRCFSGVYNYEQALVHLNKALDVAVELGDNTLLSRANMGLGNIYCEMKNPEKGALYFSKSVEYAKNTNNRIQYADALSSLSRTYLLTLDNDNALKTSLEVLKIYEEAGVKDYVGRTMLNLAIICNQQESFEQALDYEKQAYTLIDKNENTQTYLRIILTMGNSLRYLQRYEESEKYLNEVIELGEQNKALDILVAGYELGYQLFRAKQDWQLALDYLEKHLTLLNNLWDQNRDLEFRKLENEIEVIKKQHQAELYRIKTVDLKKRNTQISKQKQQLEIALNELKQANDAKDKMFSIIAHDLRGPLGSLYQGLELISDERFAEDERKSFLADLQQMSFQVYSMTDNLLRWALKQMNMIANRQEQVLLPSIIRRIIVQHQMLLKAKNITIEQDINVGNPTWIDEGLFEVVFRNLLVNAIKFTPANGKILINAAVAGNHYEFSIRDYGKGIPLEVVSSLFSQEIRPVSEGTEKERGFGLGLVICREFVHLMGGTIRVESQLNEGSNFIFTIPL